MNYGRIFLAGAIGAGIGTWLATVLPTSALPVACLCAVICAVVAHGPVKAAHAARIVIRGRLPKPRVALEQVARGAWEVVTAGLIVVTVGLVVVSVVVAFFLGPVIVLTVAINYAGTGDWLLYVLFLMIGSFAFSIAGIAESGNPGFCQSFGVRRGSSNLRVLGSLLAVIEAFVWPRVERVQDYLGSTPPFPSTESQTSVSLNRLTRLMLLVAAVITWPIWTTANLVWASLYICDAIVAFALLIVSDRLVSAALGALCGTLYGYWVHHTGGAQPTAILLGMAIGGAGGVGAYMVGQALQAIGLYARRYAGLRA